MSLAGLSLLTAINRIGLVIEWDFVVEEIRA